MDCNKVSALLAVNSATKQFQMLDCEGAKRFLNKALDLDPSIQGLSQFIAVVDVHQVAQQKFGDGSMDWYGILQVDPLAEYSIIKSQYRKLALLIHPDKCRGKAFSSEGAFLLISQAWEVLSDQSKKRAHDEIRRSYIHRTANFVHVDHKQRSKVEVNEQMRKDMRRREADTQMRCEKEQKEEKERENEQKRRQLKKYMAAIERVRQEVLQYKPHMRRILRAKRRLESVRENERKKESMRKTEEKDKESSPIHQDSQGDPKEERNLDPDPLCSSIGL